MRFCPTCGARYPDETGRCAVDDQPLETLPDEDTFLGADVLIGHTIEGRYRIERVLGTGGMGVVYLVTHLGLDKPMALKVLHNRGARDETSVARFAQEARTSSAIGHPNIVDVVDFGRLPDGAAYFVMELLEGEALTARIRRGPLPLEETIAIGEQIGSALAAAHARGIVHRDLKPDNVHLVPRGGELVVKLLDFGLAKVGGSSSKLTQTGMIFGTPHYMSPEQAAGQSVDARTDVYSLGVVLFEMATGSAPFQGDTFMGILSKHMFDPPPRPTDLLASTHALEPVILRALAKKPEERYASMDALVADLQTVQAGGTLPPVDLPGANLPGANLPGANLPGAEGGVPSRSSFAPRPTSAGTTSTPIWKGPLFLLGVLAVLLVAGGGTGLYLALGGERAARVTASLEQPDPVGAARPATGGAAANAAAANAAAANAAAANAAAANGAAANGAAANAAANGAAANGDLDAPDPLEAPSVDGLGETTAQPTSAAPSDGEVAMIRLETTPSRAAVLVEGAVVGTTPLSLPRPTEGELTVELRLRGHEPRVLTLSSASGDEVVASLPRVVHRASSTRPTMAASPLEPTPTAMRRRVTLDVADPWAE